jgi:hypothetical protein
MVRMLASIAVDRGFEPTSGQTNDYKIGICCFSAKHTASKDWLAWNHNNVSEWGEMSNRRLLFQWAGIIKIQLGILV